jgi:sugar phosphate isomerase/epimerase
VGRVPADEILKMKGRLPGGIHVKPVGAAAVGAPGEKQDWPKVIAAAEKAGVKWLVVECEKRKDTFDDIAASARYLKPLVSLVNAMR